MTMAYFCTFTETSQHNSQEYRDIWAVAALPLLSCRRYQSSISFSSFTSLLDNKSQTKLLFGSTNKLVIELRKDTRLVCLLQNNN